MKRHALLALFALAVALPATAADEKKKAGGETYIQINTLTGATNKGGYPYGQLVGDGAGNLWGTTTIGGANSVGTIYKVNLATGLLTTVVNFSDNGASNKGVSKADQR